VYGPVYSWRLGMSLGLDPLATEDKACNFDCVYCQLGKTKILTNDRQIFVKTKNLMDEIKSLPEGQHVDYLTFSGRGEPTLAANLGDMIQSLRKIRPEPIAVITNSSLMHLPEVRQDLAQTDFVLAKLDACSQHSLESIDRAGQLVFQEIVGGIIEFRKIFKGKLAIQIMLIEENLSLVKQLADIVKIINPDEVQLNTPLRPCAVGKISPSQLAEAKTYFKNINVVTVYDAPPEEYSPMDVSATIKRHGDFDKIRSNI
ncbi:MAG: radical SAM protein, partial [Candidatus Omnitrophica bacterium]|nr:radical SAM protein [Candidatus Omnitrophota bacterium]